MNGRRWIEGLVDDVKEHEYGAEGAREEMEHRIGLNITRDGDGLKMEHIWMGGRVRAL